MDLALRDIRRHLGKFLATAVGVGMLLAIVLVMNGIYRGNIFDGVWLIENTAADLWVVELGRGGPFNESSRLPGDAYKSVAAAPGVARASPFISYAAQREIAGASWRDYGAVITVRNWDEALALSDRVAPEHLEIMTADAEVLAARVRHAGAIFVGALTAEAIGDYVGGPNHVLPTARSARFSSGSNWSPCRNSASTTSACLSTWNR